MAALREWYRSVLRCWLNDVFTPGKLWRNKLPSKENELALIQIELEARNNGVRRIQRRVIRDRDGVPRELPIYDYNDLSEWCDLMLELLEDDEQHVDRERHRLTIRYDKGVAYRQEEERKERAAKGGDPWVAAMVDNLMKAIGKGEPHVVSPDDDWLLVIWGGLLDSTQLIREVVVSLFVDEAKESKVPDLNFLEDIIFATWSAMRRIGPACCPEPKVKTLQETRRRLDSVKAWCEKKLREKFTKEKPKRSASKRTPSELQKKKSKSKAAPTYDAFLAHNSKDKAAVLGIAAVLSRRKLKVWLDVEQIAPGQWFQDAIQKAILQSRAAVVIIGPNGMGRWETAELRTLLSRCVEHGVPVIPVLLPGVCSIPPELLFLKELQFVQFHRTVNEASALKALVWGISGEHPK